MKPCIIPSFFICGLALTSSALQAGDGQWSALSNGKWSDPSNWLQGSVADGVNAVATFAAPITANTMVTLDTERTVGVLNLQGSKQWNIAGRPLMLAMNGNGVPEINSRGSDFHLITTSLAGTRGFIKTGAGGLILKNGNSYSGVTTIENGKVIVRDNSSLGVAGAANGTLIKAASPAVQLHLDGASGDLSLTENITLHRASAGSSNSIYNDKGMNVLGGSLVLQRAGNSTAAHTFGLQVTTGTITLAGPVGGELVAGASQGSGIDPNRLQIRTSAAIATANFTGPVSDGPIGNGGLSLYTDATSLGVVRLSAANDYSGTTAHLGGTLLVNNTEGSGTGSGQVTIKALLGGSGLIAPGGANDILIGEGAVVRPGDLDASGNLLRKGGRLTISLRNTTGKLTFDPGSSLAFDLTAAATKGVESLAVVGLSPRQPRVYFNNAVVNVPFVAGSRLDNGVYTLVSFDAEGAYTGRLVLGPGLEAFDTELIHNPKNIQLRISSKR
jgi:autotransporter-associated beta strand protein